MTQVLGQDVPLRCSFKRLLCHPLLETNGRGFYLTVERAGIAGSAGSRPMTQSWRGQ